MVGSAFFILENSLKTFYCPNGDSCLIEHLCTQCIQESGVSVFYNLNILSEAHDTGQTTSLSLLASIHFKSWLHTFLPFHHVFQFPIPVRQTTHYYLRAAFPHTPRNREVVAVSPVQKRIDGVLRHAQEYQARTTQGKPSQRLW